MDHPATKLSTDLGDAITHVTLYKNIGFATVEEAQDILFELARARIGPETVQQICAAMMQFYFGKGVEAFRRRAPPDALAALQPHAPLHVCCNLQRYGTNGEWECIWNSWGGSYGPHVFCLEAVKGMTLQEFAEGLIKYAMLFKHEMKLRGLVFTVVESIGRCYQLKFSLEPNSGIYVAR